MGEPSDDLQHITFEGCDVCVIAPEDYDTLRAQLAAAVEKACKPHPKCPACHGGGTFQASDEGGMWVACDCAANIYLELEKAERERDEAREKYRLVCAHCGWECPLGGDMPAHIESCKKHPMRVLKSDRDRLAGEVAALREALGRLAKCDNLAPYEAGYINAEFTARVEFAREVLAKLAQGEAPADAEGGEG